MVNRRDVELNLIGHDHTDRATRDAANNFDTLERKINGFNRRIGNDKRGGVRSGTAFVEGFTATATAGMDRMFARIGRTIRMSPRAGSLGVGLGTAVGVVAVAQMSKVITAGLPAILGPGLLAGPVAYIIAKQARAQKDLATAEKRKKRLQDTIANPHTGEKSRASARWMIKHRVDPEIARLKELSTLTQRLKAKGTDFMDAISKPVQVPLIKTLKWIGDWLDRMQTPVGKIMKVLAPALQPFTKGMFGFLEGFLKGIAPVMPTIAAGMKQWGESMPKIGKAMGDMIAAILKDPKAVQSAIDGVVKFLIWIVTNGGKAIVGLQNIAGGIDEINNRLKVMDLPGEFKDIQTAIDDFEKKTSGGAGPLGGMGRAMQRQWNTWLHPFLLKMKGELSETATKMKDAMNKGVKWTVDGVRSLPGKVAKASAGLWGGMVGNFNRAIVGGGAKTGELIRQVTSKLSALPNKASSAISTFGRKVSAKVEEGRQAASRKAGDLVEGARRKLAELPGKASRALSRLAGQVRGQVEAARSSAAQKARELVEGARSKLAELPGKASRALAGVKSAVLGKFAGAGRWLYNKGAEVIRGLLNGLKAPWQAVKDWVGGIASWIKEHKGPISLDRRLLVPAGKALMSGLLGGLKFGFGPVGDFVYSAGSKVSDVLGKIKSGLFGGAGGGGSPNGSFLGGVKPVPGTGNRHSGYPWAQWAGDFPNPTGTPVHAWKAGMVTATNRWNYSYGNHIRMFHGLARTLYAHLSQIGVKTGQLVKAGQVIGAVGNTGHSYGSHLHFEKMGPSGFGFDSRGSLATGFGEGVHRQPIHVDAPQVDTRVYLDSKEMRAVIRQTVIDENKRDNWRMRTGQR